MKKNIGPFIKLLLLLAFLSRLEFVFGQGEVIANQTSVTSLVTDGKEKAFSSGSGMRKASTLGEGIGEERLALSASPKSFSNKTDLSFKLKQDGRYKLEVLDMQGQVLTVLAEGAGRAGESFVFEFKKEKFSGGAYIGRLITDHEVTSVRFFLK